MYNCHSSELLELYVDSELDAVLTRAISEHLEACPACNRKMKTLRLQNELVSRAVKSVEADNANLRAAIEGATISKPRPLLSWSRPQVPLWTTTAIVLVVVFTLTAILYLPKFFSIGANPIFEAAAQDHKTCSKESEATNWARTEPAINDLEASFIGHNRHAPVRTVSDYQLVRARVCVLNGEMLLHLVYENGDGQQTSLFVGQPHKEPPVGERNLVLNDKVIEMTHIGDLNVLSVQTSRQLLIAAAGDERLAATMLMNALVSFRG